MKTIQCFEVMGNTDTTEGRGPMKVVARFSTRGEAVKYVKSNAYAKWCVMGCLNFKYDEYNIRPATITILDSVDELVLADRESARAKALTKLTDAERELLGV